MDTQLPYGWKAHVAPNGLMYYINEVAVQGTWVRPRMKDIRAKAEKHLKPGAIPEHATKPKERAVKKVQVGDSKWYLVLTNLDNVFFYDSERKRSSWKMPKGLREAIVDLRAELKAKREGEKEQQRKEHEEEQRRSRKRKRREEGKASSSEDEVQIPVKEKTPEREPYRPELDEPARRAIFIDMLDECSVDPYASWELALSRIQEDDRFMALTDDKARSEAFDEFSKLKIAERKQAKSESTDPLSAFKKLLKDNITRKIYWDDFRRKHKKDRRFEGFGKTDKEREKVFREYMRDFEARKNSDPKILKRDFYALLETVNGLHYDSDWRKVKRDIDHDERYQAVGSSTKREDWFYDYTRKLPRKGEEHDEDAQRREKEAQVLASLREREDAVRRQQHQLRKEMGRSKYEALHEDAVRQFQTLLVDAIRTHNSSWEDEESQLSNDPRFQSAALSLADKKDLFRDHQKALYDKRLSAFHSLLDTMTSLDSSFGELEPAIKNDPRATRLSTDEEELRRLFEDYLTDKIANAKRNFEQLLKENSFVEFWGRVKRGEIALPADEEVPNKAEDESDDEDAADGRVKLEKADTGTDLSEIRAVLSNDRRYTDMDPLAEEREAILQRYIRSEMRRPKVSVHER